PPREAQRIASAEPVVPGEPWIGEAGLSEVVSSDMAFTDEESARRPEAGTMHAHVEPHGPGPLDELPMLIIPDEDKRIALKAVWDEPPPPEPTLIDPEAGSPTEAVASVDTAPPPPAEEPEIRGAEGVGAVRIVESPYGEGVAPPEPIVEWPPEDSRRILALRLIAPQAERFPGRAVRMALAAEGFLLGRFAIFHKPDEANRAVVSAASLTRPGSFDLDTMDSQRYGGLSLFAVLPGPKAPQQAFEELLASARNLNERLQGALQDERGGPLTPLRVASIRDNLRAETAAPDTAAAQ
ncbi:MAG TPA: cell division protein ZipA C-terminal FtsZ-binding domain-containing protein, partial [Steroidobacteraceae bacterium]